MAALFFRGQPPATAEDGRRSVAVFYFDNLSGDPQLDWLRTGLTDMLVTNLSQSPGLRVLGTTRLYQLLEDTGHRDDRTATAPVVAAVSRKAGATTALVGSFVRAGSQIRISASVQDPKNGEVLASERVEGDAEGGLFALVDELTGRLRKRLETPETTRLADWRHSYRKEKKLEEVTTTSVEAWKAYAEGSRLHDRLQEKDAQAYFEKAVAADPSFAMALAKLSIVHGNLGNLDKAREYSAKALDKAGNLPSGERYYIEGRHYSLDPSSIEKAIAAYQKAVDEAPDHTAARNNLAQLLLDLRRYPEALVHLEELRRRGMTFPGSYLSLAQAYVATGHPDRAREALASYAGRAPGPRGRLREPRLLRADPGSDRRGARRLRQGGGAPSRRLDEDRDRPLRGPRPPRRVAPGRGGGEAAHGLGRPAPALGGRLVAGDGEPLPRRPGEARRLAAAGATTGRNPEERVGARLFRARLEADLGRDREALAEAERVLGEKVKEPKLLAQGHAMRAICLTRLGRKAEAEKSLAEVDAFLSTIPRPLAEPGRLHLEGQIALARGDHAAARRALEKAAELAPVDGLEMDAAPVQIRYALARSALETGEPEEARKALVAVVEAGPARVMTPVPYVRSLALLASLEEKAGRMADARRLYERYLGYWKDGQIDCAEVARAGQRLAALRPRPAA